MILMAVFQAIWPFLPFGYRNLLLIQIFFRVMMMEVIVAVAAATAMMARRVQQE